MCAMYNYSVFVLHQSVAQQQHCCLCTRQGDTEDAVPVQKQLQCPDFWQLST